MADGKLRRAVETIEAHYGDRLLGAVLFGSRAKQRPRADSDWDVLLILRQEEPIRRALYAEWDERVAPLVDEFVTGISPHFVHLPRGTDELSSLWLEVAMDGVPLSDRSGYVREALRHIRGSIEAGRFEPRTAHGIRYWRRAE
jgi:predicted nucleotidyltransferase